MKSLHDHLERTRARNEADAKRFQELDDDLCQLCHAYGADKRSLVMRCLYAIEEMVPEAISLQQVEAEHLKGQGYYLRICKACRGRLLGHLRVWREECLAMRDVPKDHDGCPDDDDPERNIPYRINGATVMLTAEEYEARRKSQEGQ